MVHNGYVGPGLTSNSYKCGSNCQNTDESKQCSCYMFNYDVNSHSCDSFIDNKLCVNCFDDIRDKNTILHSVGSSNICPTCNNCLHISNSEMYNFSFSNSTSNMHSNTLHTGVTVSTGSHIHMYNKKSQQLSSATLSDMNESTTESKKLKLTHAISHTDHKLKSSAFDDKVDFDNSLKHNELIIEYNSNLKGGDTTLCKVHENVYSDECYGFIANYPLCEFSKPNSVCNDVNLDWLNRTRKVILETGVSNYKKAKILLKSNFNFTLWHKYLKQYHDKTVIEYLKYGFSIINLQ